MDKEATKSYEFDQQINTFFEEAPGFNAYDKSVINLVAGAPGPDLFEPLPKIFEEACRHRMKIEKEGGKHLFQYGPTTGLWGMREVLASFLSRNYGSPVHRENLVMTCGATHGFHLLLSTMLVPNGVIFVEEYAYAIALKVLKEFQNYKVVTVPIKDSVIDVDKLKEIAEREKKMMKWKVSEDKPFWAMLYTIPVFHNPLGSVLTSDKCRALVDVARKLDFLVMCDDVYNLIHYGGTQYPPPRLFSYDDPRSPEYRGGHVVSNGAFTKIMSPGMRVGWMEVPLRLSEKLRKSGLMQSGGSVNNVMFGIAQSIVELGHAQKQLDWYQAMYKHRMKVICDTLERNLPKGCTLKRPQGGYFLWVEIPVDGADFANWCKDRGGPLFVPGSSFRWTSFEKTEYSPALRISIGFQSANILERAAEQLSNNLKLYIEDAKNGKIKIKNKL